MTLKQIKVGLWYETDQGIGKIITVGGTHPPSVRINITHPFPRGQVMLKPREVQRLLDPQPTEPQPKSES